MMAMLTGRERLAELLANRAPVAGHKPWPRYEVDSHAWTAVAQALGEGGGDLLGLWGEKDNVHLALRVAGNGETVARLEERLGYVHRGVDGLLTDTEFEPAARVIARISGDSTVAYSFAYARAVEEALDVDPPPRAKILRGIMAELERLA